jgi:subtilisin family serine protease
MATRFGYEALGRWHDVDLLPLDAADSGTDARGARARRAVVAVRSAAPRSNAAADAIANLVANSEVLQTRVDDPSELRVVQGTVPVRRATVSARAARPSPISTYDAMTLATQTVIAEGLVPSDFKAAKDFGADVVDEGFDGKVLLRVDTVERAFTLVGMLLERNVGSATPNFLRRVAHLRTAGADNAWSHAKIGVSAAWAITQGNKNVSVAVLDEGVDTAHPALKPAVVAERDFIGTNGDSAVPDGDDAHGTACAGVVVSRDKTYPGIAPRCSLIAARIAMDDGTGHWVFDDFRTSDAIDWAWREGADVLSNSWGGGAPSNAISRAFARARTQGRNGLGSVVVIAAGNDQSPINFPGDLPGYVTVGASTPADERKTRTSSDGETWWGSNYGATMTLVAPGVFIWTTDIAGSAGYEAGNFTKTFNGTSSATPAVAAAAALLISANPALSGAAVRDILGRTAKRIQNQTSWTPELGWGRLNLGKAVAEAKAAGISFPATPAPKKSGAASSAAKKAAPRKASVEKPTTPKAPAKKTAPRKRRPKD